KIANMRGIMSARSKPLQVLAPVSPQELTKSLRFELPPAKGACKMIPADEAEKLIELLKTEAKVL
ncbi:MAG: electron transfer flavoprotein beta subunit/FixA family protein, partial [Raineya sp.]